MGGTSDLDGVEVALRRVTRNATIIAAVASGLFVVLAVLVTLAGVPSLRDWRVLYFYGVVGVSLVAVSFMPFSARKMNRGKISFLRTLQPRIREASYKRFIGPQVVFDNGLVFQQFSAGGRGGPTGWLFSLFIDSSRQVMIPSTDQRSKWARGFRPLREKIGLISSKKGPPASQAALEAIRQRLGAKKAFSILDGHPPTTYVEPGLPQWFATAVFFDNRWYSKGTEALDLLDEIRRFLADPPHKIFRAHWASPIEVGSPANISEPRLARGSAQAPCRHQNASDTRSRGAPKVRSTLAGVGCSVILVASMRIPRRILDGGQP